MSRPAPTIVFDTAPGNSGPGRYVASLLRGLEGSEFSATVLSAGDRNEESATASASLRPRQSGLRSRVVRLAPSFARNWLGFRREALRLAESIRVAGADIFHAQNTGCEEMPVAARWAGVRRVLGTFHVDSSCDVEGARSGLPYRALEWYSNRSLHQAIAVSEATKQDWIRRTGIAPDRVVTIHNGIDPEAFRRRQSRLQARAQLGLPQDALLLGSIGRLEAAKGFAYLIDAVGLLIREFPDLRIVIAGMGSQRELLRAQSERLGIAPHVQFLGFSADVNPVLDALDVFVLPSLAETLGYALLEAMAHELPAVGSHVGGIPEVIAVGQTGFLAPARDGAALAAAIRPLLESNELRERLGRAGRERVERHFHDRDMIRKTLAVYRRQLPACHAQERSNAA